MTDVTTPEITLQAFWDMLSRHDWLYQMTDDGSVYRRGAAAQANVERLAKLSPEHAALYDAWRAHVWSGPQLSNTPKLPKPERPA